MVRNYLLSFLLFWPAESVGQQIEWQKPTFDQSKVFIEVVIPPNIYFKRKQLKNSFDKFFIRQALARSHNPCGGYTFLSVKTRAVKLSNPADDGSVTFSILFLYDSKLRKHLSKTYAHFCEDSELGQILTLDTSELPTLAEVGANPHTVALELPQ